MILRSWKPLVELFQMPYTRRMKPIALISLLLSSLASGQAKPPPLFLSYQDSIGQYSFGYSDPMSARSEYRASDGVVRGAYSYLDDAGLVQTAEYEAGKDLGFRVRASNLPEAPLAVVEAPEIREVRDRQLKYLIDAQMREGRSRLYYDAVEPAMPVALAGKVGEPLAIEGRIAEVPEAERKAIREPKTSIPRKEVPRARFEELPQLGFPMPEPVKYTPEVMAAREAHFRAYENAARFAAESDSNPRFLEQLLRGHPGAPVTLPLSENKLEMPMPKVPDFEAAARRIETRPKIGEIDLKLASPEGMGRPIELAKGPENVHFSSDVITLKCETGLKVMELGQKKVDPYLLIAKPFAPIAPGAAPKISVPSAKKWAFQYAYA